jgi:hypothetical protein
MIAIRSRDGKRIDRCAAPFHADVSLPCRLLIASAGVASDRTRRQAADERGVAFLFIVSMGAFTVALVDFAREVRIALSEFDHYG